MGMEGREPVRLLFWYLALVLLVVLVGVFALASPVEADPDPPVIDGGNVTFLGDWTVDPGDHLVYVNQTIVLCGNLTVMTSAVLELFNTTLMVNISLPTYLYNAGITVEAEGRLNVTGGSLVRAYPGANPMYWTVAVDAHLLLEDSSVMAVGWVGYPGINVSGLYSMANDTVVRRCTFSWCNMGLVLDGVNGSQVVDTAFGGRSRIGLYLLGECTQVIAEGLTFSDHDLSVRVDDCQNVTLANLSVNGQGYGLWISNSSVTMLNGIFQDLSGDVSVYRSNGTLEWRVSANSQLVNCTLPLNGSLEVMAGGLIQIINATLAIDNPTVNGTRGIRVGGGGSMEVTGGSAVSSTPGGHRYFWLVQPGGRLVLEGSAVSGAGWNDSWPGLVVGSSGNQVRRTTVRDCYVGLTVSGDGNAVEEVEVDGCDIGVWWSGSNGRLANLTLSNCSATGLLLENAQNITVDGVRVNGSPTNSAIIVQGSDGVEITRIEVSGSPRVAIDLIGCSNTTLRDGVATASEHVIGLTGRAGTSSVSIASIDLQGGNVSAWLTDGHQVQLMDVSCLNASVGGLMALDCSAVAVVASVVDGEGDWGLTFVRCTDILLDRLFVNGSTDQVRFFDVDTAVVTNSILVSGNRGLLVERSGNVTVQSTTIFGPRTNVEIASSWDVILRECSLDSGLVEAVRISDGTVRCVVHNVTVSNCPTAIRMTGSLTMENLVEGLVMVNCTEGLNLTATGSPNNLRGTTMTAVTRGVVMTLGSGLESTDCSFFDCDIAILTDPISRFDLVATGMVYMVNTTVTLRGTLQVAQGGSLNLTNTDMTLLSLAASGSLIWGEQGSDLRLQGGTTLAQGSGAYPFQVQAEGGLVARNVRIVGNGGDGSSATLNVSSSAAVLFNVTFTDCGLALDLRGSFPTLTGCTFEGNLGGVRLVNTLRPVFRNCTFRSAGSEVDMGGTFNGSLQLLGTSLDGSGVTQTGLVLRSPMGQSSVVTFKNVTIANYTEEGMKDLHDGTLLMEDCHLVRANITFGSMAARTVTLRRLSLFECQAIGGPSPFLVEDCDLVNASMVFEEGARGGTMSGCTATGSLAVGTACFRVEAFRTVTLRDLTILDASVGIRVVRGSDVIILDSQLRETQGFGIEVNGSIARMERCQLTELAGTGLRVSGAGSRLEVRDSTISAVTARAGLDVDASSGGDAWFLNTTFNHSSVKTTGGGRVEVLWLVTLEPSLPWGGILWEPQLLSIVSAEGDEVVNTTSVEGEFHVHEFTEEDGLRSWSTPHNITVSDQRVGVRYLGTHHIDSNAHLVLALRDVQVPLARAGPDHVVDEDLVVTLDASGTTDNDPTFGTTGMYRWSFDEYGTFVVLTEAVARYVFTAPGKFVINLTVTDAAGNVAIDSLVVQVRDRTPPAIRFGGNVTADEDQFIIFDASATTDNDPAFDFVTGAILWEIALVEGTLVRDTATFGHTFAEPGNYSGSLTVWDRTGNLETMGFWVLVRDVTPPSIVGVSDATIFEATEGLLDASSCHDNVAVTSYQWEVEFEGESVTLNGPVPPYRFDRLGTYTVTLLVGDARGNANGTEVTVVFDDLPMITIVEWTVAMVGEERSVNFSVSDVHYTEMVVRVSEGPASSRVIGLGGAYALVWTPSSEFAGTDVTIHVEVHDGFVAVQEPIVVHVNPGRGAANRAPRITSNPPLSAKLNTPYVYSVEAEDPDGDAIAFILAVLPQGMTVSQGGTLYWDPPFEFGTVLVDVSLLVTDGRDASTQEWTIRWRDPPNQPPRIQFNLPSIEVRQREEFLVDLSVYVQGPEAYDIDVDDPNQALSWSVIFDQTLVSLASRDGHLFRFFAMDVAGVTQINFTITDPSGASDTTSMTLTVRPRPSNGDGDGREDWLLWLVLAVLVASGMAGAVVAVRSRGAGHRGETVGETGGWDDGEGSYPSEGIDLGPPLQETEEGITALHRSLGSDTAVEVQGFVELEGTTAPTEDLVPSTHAPRPVPGGTRVLDATDKGPGRGLFRLEGLAILDTRGRPLASTGRVERVVGPHQALLRTVRSRLGPEGSVTLELDGHRVLLATSGGLGALVVLKGHEDAVFRQAVDKRLQTLARDPSEEAALAAVEDMLSLGGKPTRAEVVKDAWTARLRAEVTFKGSTLVLNIRLRNDTDQVLNNARLEIDHDTDALSIISVQPRLLMSQGRVSLGNVPARNDQTLEVTLMPELCLSSTITITAVFTDREGRTVYVPARPLAVAVECPYIQAGTELPEDQLLHMSEEGLGHTGRRVFSHGIDVDHIALFRLAVRLLAELGPMKVLSLDDESLMRSEAWFLGSGEEGAPRVLARVSSHGADRLLELFVTSDDGATATGLLTWLASELMDVAASEMPGKRLERVRDASTLDDMAAWPSLLDYKVMGD